MVRKLVAVSIPETPNFIKAGDKWYSVAEFTEQELREIGKEWIEKLVDKAKKRASSLQQMKKDI